MRYLLFSILVIFAIGLFVVPNSLADKESPVLGILFPVPTSGMMMQSMGDPTDLKNIGANSMSFLIDVPYYSSG